VNVPKLANLAP